MLNNRAIYPYFHGLQLVLLYHAAVLFLCLRIILLVSRPIILFIFDGILFVKVGVTLLFVLSLALLSILCLALLLGKVLALLFWNEGGFEHLNSVALLFMLIMTLLSLPYTFFCTSSFCTSSCCTYTYTYIHIHITSLQIFVWLPVYTWVWVLALTAFCGSANSLCSSSGSAFSLNFLLILLSHFFFAYPE